MVNGYKNKMDITEEKKTAIYKNNDWVVYAIPENNEERCFHLFTELMGERYTVYGGWECFMPPRSERFYLGWIFSNDDGEIYHDDMYGKYKSNGIPFDFDDILQHIRKHYENVKKYEDINRFYMILRGIDVFDDNILDDVNVDVKITQHPIKSYTKPQPEIHSIDKYEAEGMASNGKKCRVFWHLPRFIEQHEKLDFSKIQYANFI